MASSPATGALVLCTSSESRSHAKRTLNAALARAAPSTNAGPVESAMSSFCALQTGSSAVSADEKSSGGGGGGGSAFGVDRPAIASVAARRGPSRWAAFRMVVTSKGLAWRVSGRTEPLKSAAAAAAAKSGEPAERVLPRRLSRGKEEEEEEEEEEEAEEEEEEDEGEEKEGEEEEEA